MTVVSATVAITGRVAEIEARWFDTAGWASWVDGLELVSDVDPRWPDIGASVTWQSNPAGRGRVSERCVAYTPGQEQTVETVDASIVGRQTVGFRPVQRGVEVRLVLDYRLRRRSPISPLIDRLFIRRAMTQSLQRTLGRFAGGLERGTGARGAEPGT